MGLACSGRPKQRAVVASILPNISIITAMSHYVMCYRSVIAVTASSNKCRLDERRSDEGEASILYIYIYTVLYVYVTLVVALSFLILYMHMCTFTRDVLLTTVTLTVAQIVYLDFDFLSSSTSCSEEV